MADAASDVDAARGTLDRLLAARGGSSQELPYFDRTEVPGREVLQRLMDRLKEFLQRLFGFPKLNLKGLTIDTRLILKVAMISAAALLLLTLLRRLLQNGRGQATAKSNGNEPGSLPLEVAQVEAELQAALAKGEIREALRLRWRLFLVQTVLPPHCTPAEYAARLPPARSFRGMTELYRAMFDAATTPDQQTFAAFDQWLTQEGTARAAPLGGAS